MDTRMDSLGVDMDSMGSIEYTHGDEALGDLAAGAFFDLDEDGNGEPIIWLVRGAGDLLPQPVLSITDLTPDARRFWPLLARRILDGKP